MYNRKGRVPYTTADHTNNPAWTPGRATFGWSLSRPIAGVFSKLFALTRRGERAKTEFLRKRKRVQNLQKNERQLSWDLSESRFPRVLNCFTVWGEISSR